MSGEAFGEKLSVSLMIRDNFHVKSGRQFRYHSFRFLLVRGFFNSWAMVLSICVRDNLSNLDVCAVVDK